MWGETKTFKIIYWDNNVPYGDKSRVTFYEAYDRSDAIHKFHKDFGSSTLIRECRQLFE